VSIIMLIRIRKQPDTPLPVGSQVDSPTGGQAQMR